MNKISNIDMSNNKIFIKNNPLLFSNRKKFFKYPKILYLEDNKKNIKSNHDFNIIMKELLDKIQSERDRIEYTYLTPNHNSKLIIDDYLYKVNNRFDFFYNKVYTNNPFVLNKVNNFSNLSGYQSKTTQPKFNFDPHFLYKPKMVQIPRPFVPEIKKVEIKTTVQTIKDLLQLIKDYPMKIDTQYNINMQAIHNIKEPLTQLDNMIGMNGLKSSILDQILYFVQNLHQNNNQSNDFMHTVIYGPPGTGKTEIANIMGQIFSKLGVLKNNIFKKATRTELIAGYLGQTAIKTNELVKSCLGGCLFIDEAYALGNREKRDSFAKECIDTLCEALSFHKNDLMVIIAGYEKDLKDCFFAYNSGLESRFTWRFNTDDYNASELNLIFQKKIKDIGWSHENIDDTWFEKNMDYFKYYGRDMETLLAKTKIAHSRRVFCLPIEEKKKLNKEDLDKGFEMFLSNDEVKKRKDKGFVSDMYL